MKTILFIIASAILFMFLWFIVVILEYKEEALIQKTIDAKKVITNVLLLIGIAGVITSAVALYFILKPILS